MGVPKYEHIGEVSYTKYGTETKIVDYKTRRKLLVEFQDEYKYRYWTSYDNFKSGKMTNPYDRRIFGIGYMGIGDYSFKNNKDAYSKWTAILERCTLKEKDKNNTSITSYFECSVSEEWKCFQNFAKWFEENKYYIPNERLAIDKDILCHGNKIYCKEKCLIIPEIINSLFIKQKWKRGDLPIGVTKHHTKNCYVSKLSKYNKTHLIGHFNTKEEAFDAYKFEKEKYIKELADKYKNVLPLHVYQALYNYEVLITD